jgi:large subunit ribosomal protein L6
MSRIGKQPVKIPSGVKVEIKGVHVSVQGPKGKLEHDLPSQVTVKVEGEEVHVTRNGEDRVSRSMHGLARTLVANMVQGVVEPYKKSLEVSGVGYRAELQGKTLKLQVGFAHDILHPIPDGVTCTIDKQTTIHLEGPSKQTVGQTAAEIRAYKPCEPYKGKGIKYVGEQIRRKEGKTGAG